MTLIRTLLQARSVGESTMLRRWMTTATARAKAYAPSASAASAGGTTTKKRWAGAYVPVYVAVGMIVLSAGLGLHQAKQQLMHAPDVTLKKSKRKEMLPELAEPERAVQEAGKLVNKSFFRKVAHVQEPPHSPNVPDSIRGDVFAATKPKAVTLKDVGVDPKPTSQ